MVNTEVRIVGKRRKYYRVYTYRHAGKVSHRRRYLGTDIDATTLRLRERKADDVLIHPLNTLLDAKDKRILIEIKERHRKRHAAAFQNRYEAFISEFTYDSTGIEGNTLTLRETAAVLFEGIAPRGRTLREVYEVINHKKAFDTLLAYNGDITKQLICYLQRTVTKETLRPDVQEQAGRYRTVQVFIRGATITPPPAFRVPSEMRSLLMWYAKNKQTLHPVVVAAYFHAAFEAIHPFVDGNGRTGRLLLNLMLHKNGYPMISIPRSRRITYFETLANAQQGNLAPFIRLIIQSLKTADKGI